MRAISIFIISLFKALLGFSAEKSPIKPVEMTGSSMLEEAWAEREEVVYKSLFSNMPENIYTPQDPSQVAIGGARLVLSCAGVFEIPPSEGKNYWTYITSGMSNPLSDNPEDFSGYGYEMIVRVPEKSPWAIYLLFNLMGYTLETQKPFAKGHRMPLNSPINGENSALNTVLFMPTVGIQNQFQLKSGKVQLLEVIGITEDEYQFAKKQSSDALYSELKKLPSFPLTDVTRR